MKKLMMYKYINDYGENKDIAKTLRQTVILPALKHNEELIIDFEGVSGVTQSFIHALIAEPIRRFPKQAFELIIFKNCNDMVRVIVETVEEYMQEEL